MNQTGKKIRDLRILARDTQQELADKLDISAKQLHRYEKGLSTPNAGILAAVGKIYNYDFSVDVPPQATTKKDRERMDDLVKTNRELVDIIASRLPADQQQTNVDIAATLVCLRRWIIRQYVAKPVRFLSVKDAETAFDKEVKQVIRELRAADSKDKISG